LITSDMVAELLPTPLLVYRVTKHCLTFVVIGNLCSFSVMGPTEFMYPIFWRIPLGEMHGMSEGGVGLASEVNRLGIHLPPIATCFPIEQ
jgi:hypothetical protein